MGRYLFKYDIFNISFFKYSYQQNSGILLSRDQDCYLQKDGSMFKSEQWIVWKVWAGISTRMHCCYDSGNQLTNNNNL